MSFSCTKLISYGMLLLLCFLMQYMSCFGDSFELALLISLKNLKEIFLPLPSPASGGDLLHGAGPQVHLPEAAAQVGAVHHLPPLPTACGRGVFRGGGRGGGYPCSLLIQSASFLISWSSFCPNICYHFLCCQQCQHQVHFPRRCAVSGV